MAAAATAGPSGQPSVRQSAMFDAPGRPRPLARRLAIHNFVVRSIREFFEDRRFHEIPVTAMADHPARVQLDGMLLSGFPSVWCESEILPIGGRREPRHLRGFKLMEAAGRDLSLDDLTDLQEDLLKAVVPIPGLPTGRPWKSWAPAVGRSPSARNCTPRPKQP